MRRPILNICFILLFVTALAIGSGRPAAPSRPGVDEKGMELTDSTLLIDSLAGKALHDSVSGTGRTFVAGTDSATADTLLKGRDAFSKLNFDSKDITDVVTFQAKDSVVLIGTEHASLFGESQVEYQEFKLNSAQIQMDLDSTIVAANGVKDSTGVLSGTPVFKDRSGEYESETMRYNFRNERGYITNIITEQGEGFLTGAATKKMEDGSFFLEDGFYTTCDNHDHPHFGFHITRGKMRPKKDVVTGPAYVEVAGVPLPIALPFGYFPFNKEYSSGILFPTFGEDYNRGFYARNGGYYFAINDYVDLALRGEIYSKGSWGLSGASNYTKRYKYRGNFNASYLTTVYGDKGLPDYQQQRNFQLVWSHTQDPKANPNLNFSASVNFSTSGYTRNDINSYYSNQFTENTKSSSVNLTYRIPQSKWTLSATANIAQRTQDSTLAVGFPNLNVTMAQLAPFKRKNAKGAERWYEKIRMSYSGQFQNSLTARQDVFLQKSLVRDWRNGIKHSVPVSATFSILKYLNVSPSLSFNDRMYTSKIERMWNPNAMAEMQDTVYGFYNIFDFNASLSFNTKLYGFYKPMKFLGDKVQMVRHVLTPTLSFSGAPDFSDPMWGAYGRYTYTDRSGVSRERIYSYFQHGIFGSPSAGKSGILNVNLANNLEMKVKSDADTTGVKKISLIENLSLSQSYNFAADSLRLSNLQTSILLRLTKSFNLNLQANWDPYMYGLSESGSPIRIDRTRLAAGKGWVKLASTGTSFSYTFNNDTFKRKSKDDDSRNKGNAYDPNDPDADPNDPANDVANQKQSKKRGRHEEDEAPNNDADGYTEWKLPWSLTFNYSVNYGYGSFDYKKMDYTGRWTQNLSFSGNFSPTKNWSFNFSASYDFTLHKLAYMNCTISRDLHDITMSCSFVPVGPYKSYNLHVAMKASVLRDIKLDKRSSQQNGIIWY